MTDWWRTTLILRASEPANASAELTSIDLENVFDFKATSEWPVHLGGQFEYRFGLHGANDSVEFKPLAERQMGPLGARLNLIAGHELDDDADWVPAYAARLNWRASDVVALGLEAFGEPDNESHCVGPRAAFAFGHTTFALSYLAGYHDARADGQFRLSVEIST